MSDDSRVRQLLEEILDSERSPEEVCAGSPELLPEVRRQLRRLHLVEAELEAWFPTPAPDPDGLAPAARPRDAPAPRIPGYELETVLGRGGMGIVYLARHLRLNRLVALKTLLSGMYAGPRELSRFQREAEAVAALRHPNIVQIHDIGDQDGLPYFTMEYLEGGSLAKRLAGTPQPIGQAAGLVATLAEAVHVAHQGGIVHRDLKPANILLTADGTPKISDFGLARRLQDSAGITQSGAPLGTPSYMAPEQAEGQADAIGPAVDIYALGAILYELLTGRPPFRGETPTETTLQVLHQDPVPPARLNPRVPRDLETICLHCLHKHPSRRYATALALAEDLQRFARGDPIAARPVGVPERAVKWMRRHPSQTAMLAVSLLVVVLLVIGSAWLSIRNARLRDGVEGDLKELAGLQESARWPEARFVLERADARLGGAGSGDLRRRLDQARQGLELAKGLDGIRLRRLTRGELPFDKARANREFAEVFAQAGLGAVGDPPLQVAARINTSPVRAALVAALHDWAVCATDKAQRGWLLEVARLADAGADTWRQLAFDPAVWDDPGTLADVARTAPVARESASLLLALGERLREIGGDAAPFLRRVQSAYPADFWANLVLGDAVLKAAPVEAGGYYRAALASRPGAAVGYTSLGDALGAQNRLDEATAYYRRAVDVDPQYARGHTNLGNVLRAAGEVEEALTCYQRALEADPKYAWAHFDLASLLREEGRRGEALEQFRLFHALDPSNPHVANILRADRVWRGHGEEVLQEWKKTLDADPPDHNAWFGYAELCLFLGREAEYRSARQELLRRFGDTRDPYVAERTSRAVLLSPAPADQLRVAVALAERAVATKATAAQWVYPYFLFAHGLAEYRQDHFGQAIALMGGDAGTVMGPAPRLVVAMAAYRTGQTEEARATLAATMNRFDWSRAQAGTLDHWIWHVLRREAEALIVPQLPTFLRGEYRPQTNNERLAFLGSCQFQGLYRAAAALYAEAFAADGSLAEDVTTESRYRAACCAAGAGCGRGTDGAPLSETERARWRQQARAWLRADLAARAKILDNATGAARAPLMTALRRWQNDPDLAGLRDPEALAQLPAAERQDWLALWQEVAALGGRAQTTR
jgi:serine/threonine-protein kinase